MLLLGVGAAVAVAVPVTQLALAALHITRPQASIPAGFQDWPEHRHDTLHQGASSETILTASTAYKLHWSVNTGGTKAYSSPAIVWDSTRNESLVYVGNQSGDLDAFDSATHALVWQFKVPKTTGLSLEIEASPAVSHGVVYFGAGDWHEYAVNADTGALICRSQSLGGITASSPVIGNPDGKGDVVYFGDAGPSGTLSDGGHMWAMYGLGNTGGTACTMKWIFDAFGSPAGSQTGKSGVYASPAFGHLATGAPVVVVGSSDPDDAIYELNAITGAALWRFQTLVGIDSDIGAPATIAPPGLIGVSGSLTFTDGAVYVTGKDAFTYALDLKTGAQIWVFSIRTMIGHGNPAQSGATLVGNYLYTGYGAGVFSLNAATGTLNPGWTHGPKPGTTAATTGVVSSPSVSGPSGNQVIFVGSLTGNVYAFSLATGATVFTFPTGSLIFGSAGVSTGQFFISSGGNGNLYAFGQ
jgi:outer membrane protein assembly factor BamB